MLQPPQPGVLVRCVPGWVRVQGQPPGHDLIFGHNRGRCRSMKMALTSAGNDYFKRAQIRPLGMDDSVLFQQDGPND